MEGGTFNVDDLTVHICQDISVPLEPITFKWKQATEGKGIVQDDEI